MVLPTAVIMWQAVQVIPACAWGVWTISWIGVSIIPDWRIAGSWQPPHHFEASTPATSCMYSIDLRYHWLLKLPR
jgi:hypothetical protein